MRNKATIVAAAYQSAGNAVSIVRVLSAGAVFCLATSMPAQAADAVVQWNEIAAANIDAGGRGPASFVDLAKVHLAIHDAVQAFAHDAEPYCTSIAGASGSPEAAVAAAAREVLVALLPAAQDTAVNAAYGLFLNNNSLNGDAGIAVGQQAAACILAMRATDGSFPAAPPTFFGVANPGPGDWIPTTATPTSMVQVWLATVTPFAARNSAQFAAESGPPPLQSGLYAAQYEEVKALGAKTGSSRTAAQTELAYFYSDNLILLLQRTVRTIIDTYSTGLSQSARAFALANVGAADAIIGAWDSKLRYAFWRPITAIRNGNADGNPNTVGDPTWEPLIGTPNYPEHSSGANNVAAGLMRAIEHAFHTDRLPFVAESKAALATQKFRFYERLSDLCKDMIEVRIYQGIHFRTADDVAFRTGRQSADWAAAHILKPVN
jgi:hypothetical protein